MILHDKDLVTTELRWIWSFVCAYSIKNMATETLDTGLEYLKVWEHLCAQRLHMLLEVWFFLDPERGGDLDTPDPESFCFPDLLTYARHM